MLLQIAKEAQKVYKWCSVLVIILLCTACGSNSMPVSPSQPTQASVPGSGLSTVMLTTPSNTWTGTTTANDGPTGTVTVVFGTSGSVVWTGKTGTFNGTFKADNPATGAITITVTGSGTAASCVYTAAGTVSSGVIDGAYTLSGSCIDKSGRGKFHLVQGPPTTSCQATNQTLTATTAVNPTNVVATASPSWTGSANATLNWGDGTSETVNSAANYSHTYPRTSADQTFTLTLSFADDPASCSRTTTVAVPRLPMLSCSPASQTGEINQTLNFTAAGGYGTYSWTALHGSPASGTGSSFHTQYGASGAFTVDVSDGHDTQHCAVTINPPHQVCGPFTWSDPHATPNGHGQLVFQLDNAGDATELAYVQTHVTPSGVFSGLSKIDNVNQTYWAADKNWGVVLVKSGTFYTLYTNVVAGQTLQSPSYNQNGQQQAISHVSRFDCGS